MWSEDETARLRDLVVGQDLVGVREIGEKDMYAKFSLEGNDVLELFEQR